MITKHQRTALRLLLVLPLVTALGAPAAPVSAGEEGCSETLGVCVRQMVDNLGRRGWIGIEMDQREGQPVVVRAVLPESPAAEAGMRPGDELVSFDGIAYTSENREAIYKRFTAHGPGDSLVIVVRRDGRELSLPVTLAPVPESVMAQWIGQHVMSRHLHAEDETAESGKP